MLVTVTQAWSPLQDYPCGGYYSVRRKSNDEGPLVNEKIVDPKPIILHIHHLEAALATWNLLFVFMNYCLGVQVRNKLGFRSVSLDGEMIEY